MPLSADDVATLTALGIVDPAGSPWKRMRDADSGRICFAEWVCQCGGEFKRVTMAPFERPGRMPVMLGQCSECRLICWCRWAAREKVWTGPRDLELARPMYREGGGA